MWPVLGNTLVPSGGVQFLPMSCRINGFRRQNAPEQVLPCCEPCSELRRADPASLFRDDDLEIYRLDAGSDFEDRTQEIEDRL